MSTMNFKRSPQGLCQVSKVVPSADLINRALATAKKRYRSGHLIIIARTSWLEDVKALTPADMPLVNLCIVIKHGILDRAFFSTTLTHVIKKQNYYIQILNGSNKNMRSPKSI